MRKDFPQYLGAPVQILFWDSDVLGVMAGAFGLAITLGGWFLWGLVFLLPWQYARMKKKYPRGFFIHLLYFAGLVELKRYPSYFEKRFIE
jgi:type IV conjugative transfer system protein TraL